MVAGLYRCMEGAYVKRGTATMAALVTTNVREAVHVC